jgi:AmmeMemoRadiSam system protein B
MTTRRPAVAGAFYPADTAVLTTDVDGMLAAAGPRPGPGPVAMIQPHAGYAYSGPVAAIGYRRLIDSGAEVRRVAVLCPNHTVPLRVMALPATDTWATPLGEVGIDEDLRSAIADLDGVVVNDLPHREEHAVEVHLPFLQRVLDPGWTILPIVVGETEDRLGADVVDAVLDTGALAVISSDLSHYLPHADARRRDDATIRAILDGDAEAIGHQDACGRHAVRALLCSSHIGALEPEVLDARTSADTAGGPDRTVGYTSIVWG